MKTILHSKLARTFLVPGLALVAIATSPFCVAQQQALQQIEQTGEAKVKPKAKPQPAKLDRIAEKLSVAKPVNHENLSIYLIEGEDRMDTKNVLTLSEALGKKGKVVVKETSDVNELKVKNNGKGQVVFIMAGDIVKGGKQDRTLGTDLPLETRAGEVPMSAFCVEQGRWRARGGEAVANFASSMNAVSTKDAKVAVRKAKSQAEVWDSVSKAQTKISANVGKQVAADVSPTSLQLSLEDKELKKVNDARLAVLKPIVENNERAIGFVTVINGQINSAEIFAGHDLFRRAWPKLAEAVSTEAVAEKKEKAAEKAATDEQVMEFIAKAEDAEAMKEKIHGDFWNVTAESDTLLLFQTIDESNDGRWLRRSIVKK